MNIAALRKDVEQQLNVFDPVGAKLRSLKKRLTYLEKKKSLTAKEFKEISSSILTVRDLEKQRQELAKFESSLDANAGKLMRLSKSFDTISEQYDRGKLDPVVYEASLRKMQAKFYNDNNNQPHNDNGAVWAALSYHYHGAGRALEETITHGCMAFFMLALVIPILFSCSFH